MNDNKIELKEVEDNFLRAKEIADKEGKVLIVSEDKVEYILVKNETKDKLATITDEEIQEKADKFIKENINLLRRLS